MCEYPRRCWTSKRSLKSMKREPPIQDPAPSPHATANRSLGCIRTGESLKRLRSGAVNCPGRSKRSAMKFSAQPSGKLPVVLFCVSPDPRMLRGAGCGEKLYTVLLPPSELRVRAQHSRNRDTHRKIASGKLPGLPVTISRGTFIFPRP